MHGIWYGLTENPGVLYTLGFSSAQIPVRERGCKFPKLKLTERLICDILYLQYIVKDLTKQKREKKWRKTRNCWKK